MASLRPALAFCSSVAVARGRFCGGAELQARSYLLPPRFPFPPVRLVMESTPGSCDYYTYNFCEQLEADQHFEPDYAVREVIASFLDGCHWRSCAALDLGANNGWMTAYMLALGSAVLAVEPQPDLAEALRATIELNCWQALGTVRTAYVDARPGAGGQRPVSPWLWREGGQPQHRQVPVVDVLALDTLLFKAARPVGPGQFQLDFVKMDADGPEGRWLKRLEKLIDHNSTPSLQISTLVVECHDCSPQTLFRMQQRHRYRIYVLDMHLDQRFLDARGHDVYQGFAVDETLPAFLEELYSVRFMRHLYHVKPATTLAQWRGGIWKGSVDLQYLLTREELLEPRREHPYAAQNPHSKKGASGYAPPHDGIG